MIPMPNSGLADPVNQGLSMGLAGCRVRLAAPGSAGCRAYSHLPV